MTITARNYHDAARADLEYAMETCLTDGMLEEAAQIAHIIEIMDRAVRFSLPDDGLVLDDELKGLKGQPLHLPFPAISIEYFKAADVNFSAPGAMPVTKRLVVAEQSHAASDEGVAVYGINFVKRLWCPDGIGLFIFKDWDRDAGNLLDTRISALGDGTVRGGVIHARGIVVLPNLVERFVQEQPGIERQLWRDAAIEGRVLLELCEALSCRNVSHEPRDPVDPRVNARRIRDGKKPLVETRILTIEVPGREGSSTHQGGHHASPRQHLRRGHIRRYQDGHQVWINSTVVGDPTKGRIKSGYEVTN